MAEPTLQRRTGLVRRTPIPRTGGLKSGQPARPATRHRPARRDTGPTKAVVALILERAGWQCEVCAGHLGEERGRTWSVQHRHPRQMGGTRAPWINFASNLLVACGHGTAGCNGRIESERSEATDAGWLVPSGVDPATVPVLLYDGRRVLLADDGSYREVS